MMQTATVLSSDFWLQLKKQKSTVLSMFVCYADIFRGGDLTTLSLFQGQQFPSSWTTPLNLPWIKLI